jgi:hypothetical protein
MNQRDEQCAEELEAILLGAEAEQALPFAPAQLKREDADLATQLVHLASTIQADRDFAATLEAELLSEGRAKTPPHTRAPRQLAVGGSTGAGSAGASPRIASSDGARTPREGRVVAPRSWRLPATIAALLLLSLLMIAPTARAALQDVVRLGAVRIFTHQPTTSTAPAPTPLSSVLDLAGETSLEQARHDLPFPITLPSYPADLGAPKHVYVQNLLAPAVVLVWMDKQRPSQVNLTLQELGSDAIVWKTPPQVIQQTAVHGHLALWVSGRYNLQYRVGDHVEYQMRSLVDGHTLIWTEGAITYRLETRLPLPEAIQVAESLH